MPNDFRDALDNLGTHDAEEASTEYIMRVHEKKVSDHKARNRGLGGLIRGVGKSGSRVDGDDDDDDDDDAQPRRSRVLSAASIVGADPTNEKAQKQKQKKQVIKVGSDGTVRVEEDNKMGGPIQKKKGSVFQWLDSNAAEKEEMENLKREKLNELYHKKMMEKQQQERRKSE